MIAAISSSGSAAPAGLAHQRTSERTGLRPRLTFTLTSVLRPTAPLSF
jgi:hypothetical protein